MNTMNYTTALPMQKQIYKSRGKKKAKTELIHQMNIACNKLLRTCGTVLKAKAKKTTLHVHVNIKFFQEETNIQPLSKKKPKKKKSQK